MAQYYTDFSEYTTDAAPSDWTARWVTTNSTWVVKEKAGTTGGKCLQHTSIASYRRLLSWNDIDGDADRDDVEILCKFRSSSTSTDQFRFVARASGAAAAENCYYLACPVTSGNDAQFKKYLNGTSSVIGSEIAAALVVDTWYWARVRINGVTLKARLWSDGSAEPGTWNIETTDSSISAAGWVGIGNLTYIGTRDFDVFAVGTNGDAAPSSAPSSGEEPVVSVSDASGANGAALWVTATATDSDGTIATLTASCVDSESAAVAVTTHNLTGIGTDSASVDIQLPANLAIAGTYTLTVTATDDDANEVSDTATLTINTVTAKVSQGAIEAALDADGGAAVQVSQVAGEVAWSSNAMCFAQVSQDALETVFDSDGAAGVQVSQDALEVVIALAEGGDGDPIEPPVFVGAPHSLFYYDERDGRVYDLILPPRPQTFPDMSAAVIPDSVMLDLTPASGAVGTDVGATANWTVRNYGTADPGGFKLADWEVDSMMGGPTLHIDTDTVTTDDYLYYTFGTPQDLSSVNEISFAIRSTGEDLTGTILYFCMGETDYDEIVLPVTVERADTVQTISLDLTGQLTSTRNAITKMGFKAAVASEFVVWIGDIYAGHGITGEKRYKIRDVRIQGWQSPVNTELRLPSPEAPPPYADDEVINAGTVGSVVTLTRASLPPGLAEWEIWRTDDGVTGKYHYVGKVGEDHDRWQPETVHTSGDTVRPSTLDKGRSGSDQFYYTCTTAGTTGDRDSEPTWPTTPAATVTDGTVVWTLSDAAHKFSVLSYADDVVDIADNPLLKEMRVQVPTPASSVGIHEGRLVLYVREPGEEDKREKTGHLWGSGRDDIANWFDWLPGEIPDLGDFVADGDGWCLPLGEAGEVVRMDPLGAWTGASYTGPLMLSTTAGWNVGLQGDTPFNTSVAYRRRGGCCGAYAGCRDTTGFVALADPDGNVTLWDWQMRPTLLSQSLEATLRDATDAQRLDWVLGYDARMLRLAVYAKDAGFYVLDTRKDGQGDPAGWDQLGTDLFGVPRCMAARPGPDGYLETGRTTGTVWRLFDPEEPDAPFVYKARAIGKPGRSLVPVRLFPHHGGTAFYSVDRDSTRVWTRRALPTGRPAVGLPQNKPGRTVSVEMQSLSPWTAATAYAAGSFTTNTAGNKWFSTVNGGTTGATEPTWVTTTAGVSTTTDGTVTWLYRGAYTPPAIYSVEAEIGEMWT